MITFKENGDKILIKCATSTFSFCMTYCEHKIPFYLEGIKPPRHEESDIRKSIGAIFHAKEEKKDKEKVIPLTKRELDSVLPDRQYNIEFAREHIFSKLSYSINKDNKDILLILTGRPDKLLRKDEFLVIEEDKFPKNPFIYTNIKNPFDNHILQSLVYLNSKFSIVSNSPKKEMDQHINRHNIDDDVGNNQSDKDTYQKTINMFFDMTEKDEKDEKDKKYEKDKWYKEGDFRYQNVDDWFDVPHQKKKWIINIRDSESDIENNIVKTFEGIQNDNDSIYLQKKMTRFIKIILGGEQKHHHDNFKKCIPCEYADICRFSLKYTGADK